MDKLKSRKLIVTILGAVAAAVGPMIGFSPQTIDEIVGLVAVYVVGQGTVDAVSVFKKPAQAPGQ